MSCLSLDPDRRGEDEGETQSPNDVELVHLTSGRYYPREPPHARQSGRRTPPKLGCGVLGGDRGGHIPPAGKRDPPGKGRLGSALTHSTPCRFER